MLQVSMGALVSLVIILLVCFVLPLAFFYVLYRAECKFKTMAIGALAYLVCGIIADTMLVMGLDAIAEVQTNTLMYILYASLLSPVLFVTVNYFLIRRLGALSMKTTGDSLMYALGYGTLCNIVSTGIVAIMYFLSLLDIKERGEYFRVVSDADYVSLSDKVSGSDIIVNETVFGQMRMLASQPVSYYMGFIFNCLWVFAIYGAIFMVIWLSVKKKEKKLLLAFAFVIRLFATLPDVLDHFKLIGSRMVSGVISLVVLILVWIAAILCRKVFIDAEEEYRDESVKESADEE